MRERRPALIATLVHERQNRQTPELMYLTVAFGASDSQGVPPFQTLP
jgi:hypothetical protein